MSFSNTKAFILSLFLLCGLLFGTLAHAGHLFTQAQSNSPISLSAGQGLNVTQLTYEGGGGSNGLVTIDFGGDWSAGDAIKITIGNWSETFAFNTIAADNSAYQDGTYMQVQSSALVAAGLNPSGQIAWTVIATAGQFTWHGYRIYTTSGTFDGTGAAPINQSQVVDASQLGGGGNYSSVATPNQTGVAATLDGLSGATGQMGGVLAVLDAMTDQSKRDAMRLISPDRSQVVGQSAINTTTAALDTVQVRLDNLRVGMSGQNDMAMIDHRVKTAGHGTAQGMSSGDAALDKTVWIKAFGGKADQAGRDGFAGSDSKILGMMAGADRMLENGLVLGAAVAYANTNVDMNDFRNGDSANIKTYQLTGYFAKNFERWFLQGMLSYAYQDYDTKRNTHLTGLARGNFSGNMVGTRVVAGIPFQITEVYTLTPSMGIEAYRINQDGFREKGAGVLSLNVGSSDADRVRSLMGLELGMLKVLADGSRLHPSLKAIWRHDFIRDGMATTSSFLGGGAQFESVGQKVNQDVYGLIAKLNWEKTERVGLAVEVGSEQGDGYDAINAQVTGTYRF